MGLINTYFYYGFNSFLYEKEYGEFAWI